jgi:hypothetical protein
MKIHTPSNNPQQLAAAIEALEQFLAQPSPQQAPPCPGCTDHTPERCTPNCTEAPAAMSIDPVQYPIEQYVVPLVYDFFAMKLVEPCWSCEGHTQAQPDGELALWKVPQVCFYSASPVYPQLLLKCLNNMKYDKKLYYAWHVVIADFSQSWDTTYSLQPDLNLVEKPNLVKLQTDLIAISQSLYQDMRHQAGVLLQQLKQLKAAS